MDEAHLSGNDIRHAACGSRPADDSMGIRRFGFSIKIDGNAERLVVQQFPIGHRAVGCARADQPVGDLQRRRFHVQRRRRQLQQMPPGRGRG